jgi:hypothetical protein
MKNWNTLRLGFRCRCEHCLRSIGPITHKVGKFWQARYGESAQDFKKRVVAFHLYEERVKVWYNRLKEILA